MTKLKKAYFNDLPRIYPLLLELNPKLSLSDWTPVFQNPWKSTEDFCGYMLTEDDVAVGFINLIFSSRIINGQSYKFCDIGSWIVKEKYRSQSLSLLLEVLKLKDYTFTTYTTNQKACALLKKLGFKDYQTHSLFIPSIPFFFNTTRIEIETDPAQIYNSLEASEQKIFSDYQNLYCRHILLKVGTEVCYIIAKPCSVKKLPSLRICYVSHPNLFGHNIAHITWLMALKLKIAGLLINKNRILVAQGPLRFNISLPIPYLYKSSELSQSDFDVLYSELFLLKVY